MRWTMGVAGLFLLGSAAWFVYPSFGARGTAAETAVRSEARDATPKVKASRPAVLAAARTVEERSQATTQERSRAPRLRLKDVLTTVPAEQRASYFRRLKELEMRRRIELAEDDIATEPRDAELQAEIEAEARAALESLDESEFPTTRLGAVECGSTLCKIEVHQDSAAEQDAFSAAFALERRNFAARRGADEEPGQRRGYTIIVAKAGRRLPRADLEDVVALLSIEDDGYSTP